MVVDQNDDGTLVIHWKAWPSKSWKFNIKRDYLIIKESTIAQLAKSKKKKLSPTGSEEESAEENANMLRTWADKSGKFKVEATLSSRTKDEVILLTEAGKQLKVRVDKLCEEDQAFLESIPEEIENPFAE